MFINCSKLVELYIGYLGILYLFEFLVALVLPPIKANLNPTSWTLDIAESLYA